MKAIAIALIAVLAIGGVIFMMNINYNNQEVRLRNSAEAQKQVVEGNLDKMWKILKDQAGVADKYKDSFKDIYVGIMEGRYSGDNKGEMMLWIKEQNPEFSPAIFDKLMTSIEAQRTEFFFEQKKLVSIVKQHKDLLQCQPSGWFLGGKEPIEIVIISSSETKQIMQTGRDDRQLFD